MFLFKRNVQGWLLPVGIDGQEVAIAYDLRRLKDLVNDSIRSNLNRFRFRNAFFGLNGTTVEGFVWIYVGLPNDSSHLKRKVTKLQKKGQESHMKNQLLSHWHWNHSTLKKLSELRFLNTEWKSTRFNRFRYIFYWKTPVFLRHFRLPMRLRSLENQSDPKVKYPKIHSSTGEGHIPQCQETVSSNTTKLPETLTQDHWACIIHHKSPCIIIYHHASSCISRYHHLSSCIITNHHASCRPWWWISTITSETPDINRKTSNSVFFPCRYQCHDSSSVDPPKSPQNWTVRSLRVPMTRWCSPCHVPKVPTLLRNRR